MPDWIPRRPSWDRPIPGSSSPLVIHNRRASIPRPDNGRRDYEAEVASLLYACIRLWQRGSVAGAVAVLTYCKSFCVKCFQLYLQDLMCINCMSAQYLLYYPHCCFSHSRWRSSCIGPQARGCEALSPTSKAPQPTPFTWRTFSCRVMSMWTPRAPFLLTAACKRETTLMTITPTLQSSCIVSATAALTARTHKLSGAFKRLA